jgi:hypothetical protein
MNRLFFALLLLPTLALGANIPGSSVRLSTSEGLKLSDLVDGGYDVTVKTGDLITRGSWVDVRSYLPTGYVTDGSVDYTTYARQALSAINAAGGGTLYIPPHFTLGVDYADDGKCALDLSGMNNVTIRGEGPSSIIKKITELENNPPGLIGIYDTSAAGPTTRSNFTLPLMVTTTTLPESSSLAPTTRFRMSP